MTGFPQTQAQQTLPRLAFVIGFAATMRKVINNRDLSEESAENAHDLEARGPHEGHMWTWSQY